MAAYSYCEPVTAASGFGWYVFPPLNFGLVWDGREVGWTYEGAAGWEPLRTAPYPGFNSSFERLAPAGMSNLLPTFLAQGKMPGTVQVGSGFLAKTLPGWALLSRGIVNLAQTQPCENHEMLFTAEEDESTPAYVNYEGIIETDRWLYPIFTNVRLMRINSPVLFHVNKPFFQVQPILLQCYRGPSFTVDEADALTPEDWQRFAATMEASSDHMRRPGHYAVEARRRAVAE